MTLPPNNFFSLCHQVGSDPCLIQGPGGNVSVKQSNGLFIKASGSYLKSMSESAGWVAVDLEEFRNHFLDLARTWAADPRQSPERFEAEYSSLVKRVSLSSHLRASMELGFHALLPQPWIVHVHSLASQVLAQDPARRADLSTSVEGIPSRFIPYTMPGFRLSWRIHEVAETLGPANNAFLFLENHGLIVASESSETALQMLAILEEPRNLWQEAWSESEKTLNADFLAFYGAEVSQLKDGCVFPDFAMLAPSAKLQCPREDRLTFDAKGLSPQQKRDTAETITAAQVLLRDARTKGISFRFLDSNTQENLRDLPTEIERMRSRERTPS